MSEKWLMFKNYMHNELGITKKDIRQWVEDAVHEEARRMMREEFHGFDTKKIVKDLVEDREFWGSNHIKDDIKKEVVDRIMSKLIINTLGDVC